MELFFICLKIFSARILDVTIATFRQNVMLKGKIIGSSILAFIEIMIWFLVAREALIIAIDSFWIPISYSLGYATGTLIGSILSKHFIKGEVGLQIIIDENKKELLNSLKIRGYPINVLHLESGFNSVPKLMLFLEVKSKSLKKIQTLIQKNDPDAFIVVSDTKRVLNGFMK